MNDKPLETQEINVNGYASETHKVIVNEKIFETQFEDVNDQ